MMQTNATPLVWAVNFAKTTVVVELLINAKADVNAIDGVSGREEANVLPSPSV